MAEKTSGNKSYKKVYNAIGFAVCVLLTLIIIVNGTMIIKSYLHPGKVPDFLGINLL